MPRQLDDLGETPLIRGLFLGNAKCGKTCALSLSAGLTFGPGYLICCSSKEHLRGAKQLAKEKKVTWAWDLACDIDSMERAIKEAREGVKAGRYKWVLVDDFNLFACEVERACSEESKGDGRRFWQQYRQIIRNNVLRMFDLQVHIMYAMHYIEVSDALIEGQVAKKGVGIVPMLAGMSRSEVPGLFNQVVWMDYDGRARTFKINPQGVWGPGVHGVRGSFDIPADVGELVKVLGKSDWTAEAAKVAGKEKKP